MAKPLSEISAAQLEARIAKAQAESSRITRAFIDAGRGFERPREIEMQTDPLSLEYRANAAILYPLYEEEAARKRYHGSLRPIRRKAVA